MTKLEELFIDYLNSDENTGKNRTIQVEKASEAMNELIAKSFPNDRTAHLNFENVSSELTAAYEEQGFYAGFKYAMKLAKECF